MTEQPDDEKVIAALLRRVLREPPAARNDCPGPDILAGFYDRTLSESEIRHYGSHVAACARCRQQLAALARSDDISSSARRPAAVRAWWRTWRWIVPATAAAVLVVWAVTRPVPPANEGRTTLRMETGRDAADRPRPPESKEEPAAGRPLETARPDTRKAPPVTAAPEPEDRTGKARRQRRDEIAELADRHADEQSATRLGAGQDRLTSAGARTAGQGEQAELQREKTKPAAKIAGSQAAPASGAGGSAPAPRPAAVAESLAQAERGQRSVIASPGGAVLWRLGPAASLERSRDSGVTWTTIIVPAQVDLLAASAPSAIVCWVVGRAGIVLQTADGERWRKVSSPTPHDLLQVEARDSLRATVTDAGGQRYSTTDGGRTWQ